ncbi:SRPBCC family protein [Paramicrobacterium chengjingii]|uniref:SRPBCC domain-containing protein n=1 Tax=Paramicrobacterium chengjingii TaxID=2769067 RepID=A0ABX6YM70_9MICO|nr:SRPBCC domain-containing protein [Microbacterium chengjingii]QPZ39892.1 SRPBCC domain-containing protein [Microbacterium chengjingii]
MVDRAGTGRLGGVIRDVLRPRHEVWRLWSEPEFIRRWFWESSSDTEVEFVAEVGQRWRVVTSDVSVGGQITEVVPGEKLAFTMRWAGDTHTLEVDVRLLDDHAGGTTIEISESGSVSEAERDEHVAGWVASLARMTKIDLSQ